MDIFSFMFCMFHDLPCKLVQNFNFRESLILSLLYSAADYICV